MYTRENSDPENSIERLACTRELGGDPNSDRAAPCEKQQQSLSQPDTKDCFLSRAFVVLQLRAFRGSRRAVTRIFRWKRQADKEWERKERREGNRYVKKRGSKLEDVAADLQNEQKNDVTEAESLRILGQNNPYLALGPPPSEP